MMKHVTPKGFGSNALVSTIHANEVTQLEHSNYVGAKASMTERYCNHSEALYLKCAAVLCDAANTAQREQRCAQLPATTLHLAEAVRVTEAKAVCSIQRSPPPVVCLSMPMDTEEMKVRSC